MTEMLFRETAAHALVSTVSGWHLWEMASTRNKYKNRATPMEARIGMEVGHAAARQGMTREKANEIALKLLAKYEDQAATASKGSMYQECYNVETAQPTQEHYDMFRKIKDEIADLGVEFPVLGRYKTLRVTIKSGAGQFHTAPAFQLRLFQHYCF